MTLVKNYYKLAMVVFGLALVAPAAMTLLSSDADASGYMVASGRYKPICNAGGADECPDDGEIGGSEA